MHQSVLLKQAVQILTPQQGDVILDATIGCGGHAAEILKRIDSNGKLIGIDCDKKALGVAGEKLATFKDNLELIEGNFRNLDKILNKLNIKAIDGALFDLGVSSLQLNDPGRGFSFRIKSRLDMRMDLGLGNTAYDVVNKLSESDLGQIIKSLGEERYHKKISASIVSARKGHPIEYTTELAEIIRKAIHRGKYSRIDPATRTFQALRIFVNDELGALREALNKMPDYLRPGARMVVISFHSLEDRIVKRNFRDIVKKGIYISLTKKVITPDPEEIKLNPRSRSAKLRAVERI